MNNLEKRFNEAEPVNMIDVENMLKKTKRWYTTYAHYIADIVEEISELVIELIKFDYKTPSLFLIEEVVDVKLAIYQYLIGNDVSMESIIMHEEENNALDKKFDDWDLTSDRRIKLLEHSQYLCKSIYRKDIDSIEHCVELMRTVNKLIRNFIEDEAICKMYGAKLIRRQERLDEEDGPINREHLSEWTSGVNTNEQRLAEWVSKIDVDKLGDVWKHNERQFTAIKDLKDNWNGYKAKAPSEKLVSHVRKILNKLQYKMTILPTANDSIQIEKEIDDDYIEFNIYEDRISVFSHMKSKERMWSLENVDISKMMEILDDFHSTEIEGYEIWMEGYQMNGNRGTASFLGVYEGRNFRDAVEKYIDEKPERRELYNPNGPSIWGCHLYDNEVDARKSFG